jgi:zinc ribbon protein/Sel1 repeat-containing protein
LRCPRCGNENPAANRFCGMCGATLLHAPATAAAAVGQSQASVARNAADSGAASTPVPTAVKATPPVAPLPGSADPVISGPSFLGLNQPASNQPPATASRRSSLSISPHSAPSSRSLDYLLEDEEPRGGGGWKFFLILVALALAVGFGYLRWKHQGLDWLISGTKSALHATQTSEPADSSAPAPSSSGTASASPPAASPTAPAGSPPAPADSTATPSSPAPASANSSANPGPGAATSAAPASATNPPSSPAAAPPPKPETAGEGDAPKSDSSSPPAAAESTVAKDSSSDASDASPDAVAEKPKDVPVKTPPKPAAAVRPATADPVAEAQKYLYGRGARQDCERGIRILKPAAAQSNPKAMIEMGALYSAGLCTPRDLPTAYRWFALALRKDPENQAVQTDLKKLWGEMTQPERQLAIRLSQ